MDTASATHFSQCTIRARRKAVNSGKGGATAGRGLAIGAWTPKNVLLAAVVQMAGKNEKKIGEAVRIMNGERVQALLFSQFRHFPLGPADNGAREVKMG